MSNPEEKNRTTGTADLWTNFLESRGGGEKFVETLQRACGFSEIEAQKFFHHLSRFSENDEKVMIIKELQEIVAKDTRNELSDIISLIANLKS